MNTLAATKFLKPKRDAQALFLLVKEVGCILLAEFFSPPFDSAVIAVLFKCFSHKGTLSN